MMKKLSELYNSILDEDYPSHFDMEEFKSLTSFNKRVKYCTENLKKIASGSGRIVYMVDNEKVLKLAKNNKGVAQCEVEIDYGEYPDLDDIVAKVFDSHPDGLWVEMELARKLTKPLFKQITGFNFDEYAEGILHHGHNVNKRGGNPFVKPEIMNNMWEDEDFAYHILSFIGNYGIPAGDLAKISSYGIVKRDGQDIIVIIDYGLTDEVYDNYYS